MLADCTDRPTFANLSADILGEIASQDSSLSTMKSLACVDRASSAMMQNATVRIRRGHFEIDIRGKSPVAVRSPTGAYACDVIMTDGKGVVIATRVGSSTAYVFPVIDGLCQLAFTVNNRMIETVARSQSRPIAVYDMLHDYMQNARDYRYLYNTFPIDDGVTKRLQHVGFDAIAIARHNGADAADVYGCRDAAIRTPWYVRQCVTLLQQRLG